MDYSSTTNVKLLLSVENSNFWIDQMNARNRGTPEFSLKCFAGFFLKGNMCSRLPKIEERKRKSVLHHWYTSWFNWKLCFLLQLFHRRLCNHTTHLVGSICLAEKRGWKNIPFSSMHGEIGEESKVHSPCFLWCHLIHLMLLLSSPYHRKRMSLFPLRWTPRELWSPHFFPSSRANKGLGQDSYYDAFVAPSTCVESFIDLLKWVCSSIGV